MLPWIGTNSSAHHTVCPRSSNPFFISKLLYKMGNYFLDTQYVPRWNCWWCGRTDLVWSYRIWMKSCPISKEKSLMNMNKTFWAESTIHKCISNIIFPFCTKLMNNISTITYFPAIAFVLYVYNYDWLYCAKLYHIHT